MHPLFKRFLALLGVALLVATASWFLMKQKTRIKIANPQNQVEHQLSNLTMEKFDAKGQLEYTITTPKTFHQNNIQRIEIPHIVVTKENQPQITIDANTGFVKKDGQEIQLKDDVTVVHEAFKAYAKGVLKTSFIRYFPKQNEASTNALVEWDQNQNHLETVGLKANIETREVELQHDVKGNYYSKEQGNITFSSGYAYFNEIEGRGLFKEAVRIDGDKLHLRAHKAKIFTDEKHKLVKAEAHGHKDALAHAWIKAMPDKPFVHAFADRLIYHPESNKLELVGKARIKLGKNQMTASHMWYDLKTETLSTTAKSEKRTHIQIDPGMQGKSLHEHLSAMHDE